MADSQLNADLAPVHWTTGAATREPRQEGRHRGRDHKGQKSPVSQDQAQAAETQADESGKSPNPETPAAHKLDSFA
jgi:hypothetical protein